MTFSDALPVQFWASSATTFNEKTLQGVFEKCFCQPWQCDDEISLQLTDTLGQVFKVLVKNSDDEYLAYSDFTEIASGVYTTSFTPEDKGVCNEDVTLEIIEGDDIAVMAAPSAWDNGANPFDTKTATTFVELLTSADNLVYQDTPFVVPVGTVITISYTIAVVGSFSGAAPMVISFSLRNAAGGGGSAVSTGLLSTAEKTITAEGTYNYTEVLTATATSVVLSLTLVEALASGTPTVTITISPGDILYVNEDNIVAKSDCLNIKTTQDETVLITYSDNKTFASLQYSAISPDPEFTIRVPATFFHERFPEESEVIELSNSRSIQLNAQVKAQRHLEIGHIPYYMHRKLKLILKHQFVEIDGQDWVQSEAYELVDSNRRFPMRKANVWLDEKDYIIRNVL